MEPAAAPVFSPAARPVAIGHYRWRMLGLIFFATTINYMDRTVLTVLAPILQYRVFHWTDSDYATVTMAFQGAYAIGLVSMGAILDKLGTRLGYTISIITWGAFDLLQAAVRPAFGRLAFPAVRFGFGFGQAGTYPAAVKSVAEWFPRTERALATGIFNAGSNMGAILAPLFVPMFVSSVDGAHWELAFLVMGALSAGCAVLWWNFYRRPAHCPGLSAAERAYIEADQAGTPEDVRKLKWRAILPKPETWAFAACKLTDVAWWFYTFWVGKFFFDLYGLSLKTLAVPLMVIFISADVGSIGGGWFSSHLLKRGWTVNRARKTTMLVCALAALPVGLATHLGTHFDITAATGAQVDTSAQAATTTARLQPLVGHTYRSARAMLASAEEALGAEERKRLETGLIQQTRSDHR